MNANLSQFRAELESLDEFGLSLASREVMNRLEVEFNQNPSLELARQIFALRRAEFRHA